MVRIGQNGKKMGVKHGGIVTDLDNMEKLH